MTHEERLDNGGWAWCRWFGAEQLCWVSPRDLWDVWEHDTLPEGFVSGQVSEDGPNRPLEFLRWHI